MLASLLLFTFLGLAQGYVVFDPDLLKLRSKLNATDLEYRGHYLLSERRPVNEGPIPDYIDWRKKNVVTPIKDQLGCDANWAFSIVAAVESHFAILTGKREIMSEQFLIDCDPRDTGCATASLLDSYSRIVNQIGGVLRERDYYPFENRQSSCRWKPPSINSILPRVRGSKPEGNWQISHAYPVPVIGYTRIKNNEDEMADALFRYGPLTAAINSASMATYKRGSHYIDEPSDEDCDPTKPDHSVLIVGYSAYESTGPNKAATKYWIIKNSWGEQFGDNGYYYLVRGRNACGIANDVSLPYVSK